MLSSQVLITVIEKYLKLNIFNIYLSKTNRIKQAEYQIIEKICITKF